jgi:hypothetical protein
VVHPEVRQGAGRAARGVLVNLHEEHTERQWFLRDKRDALHRCDDEQTARDELADYTKRCGEGGAVFYRDVITGALTEVDR